MCTTHSVNITSQIRMTRKRAVSNYYMLGICLVKNIKRTLNLIILRSKLNGGLVQ